MAHDTLDALTARLSGMGAELLVDTLEHYPARLIGAQQQDPSQITHAPKLTVNDVTIEWNAWTAQRLERMQRAVGSKLPLRTMFRTRCMHLSSVQIPAHPPQHRGEPGTIHMDHNGVFVACNDGSEWIQLLTVKVEGKRAIPVQDWINGYGIREGEQLGTRV
jgi:methionyl-tRNA formyltransferase